jgi:hypothetical protein
MSSVCKATALVLLTALIGGCSHKAPATPPPAAQAPVIPVSTMAKDTPPPQLPPPQTPKVGPPGPTNTAAAPQPKPHKIIHHKPKPAEQSPSPPTPSQAPATTEQAANGTAGDVSPIGQLSEAGESVNAPRRHQILDDINSTEKGLNDIKRQMSADEQTTAAEIRTFLVKAKDALNQEDLDGANTLVTKAKVLLAELSKP